MTSRACLRRDMSGSYKLSFSPTYMTVKIGGKDSLLTPLRIPSLTLSNMSVNENVSDYPKGLRGL